ncbi:MAG: discoidin domain-containing protein [Candidatus Bathyarchaeum tardum]|nr:MAG: discoidin domain-containing protein [Candidatus Bathyarchaeum tardum]
MKKCSNRANKGQFSIIAALLVSVILVSAVISTYTNVRHSEVPESSNVLSVIGQMNSDIKSILDFTVGYYGSILQVTGNSTYAKNQTTSYLSSGLVNIARSHPEWNPTFTLDLDGEYADVSTRWFMPDSYSRGSVNVTYSIGSLGIYDVSFHASSALHVTILEAPLGFANISITRDNSEPELGLSKENFWFFTYTEDSTWELINPPEVRIINGFYIITLPSGVDTASYSVQVEDNRGLLVSAFYSQKSVASESRIPHFTYYFDWGSTGVLDIYNSLETDIFAIELLQNGTLKWLGQPLEVPDAHPIPPVSIKAFRVNATIDDNSCEIPFQVEDWASDYTVPLGLSGNNSIFNNNNMLVFLVNNTIDEITLWWDGNDTAIQTSYAWENIYFDDDVDLNPGTLYNGFLDLTINNFWIESSVRSNPSVRSTANFAHFNLPDGSPQYGDQLSYVIYNGIVRDIVQQEPEYSDGVDGCPNLYVQVFLTLPANAPYYTYSVRTVFLESVSHPRTITDFRVIQLSSEWAYGALKSYTEDGTSGIYPVVTETTTGSTDLFDNSPSSGGWEHHWSEYILDDVGGGLMVTDVSNNGLYAFDGLAGDHTGALKVTNEYRTIWTTPYAVYGQCGGSSSSGNSIDSRTNTYWRHDSSENHWIIFDMGETIPISGISIYQPSYDTYDWGRTSGIEIYVSNDPESWGSPVWTGRIDGYQWEESDVFSAEGRYVILRSLSTSSSQRLYEVRVATQERMGIIEFNPVEVYQVTDFDDALDITWYGAVVTFDEEPIYPESGINGLWVMVAHPPTVSMD